MKFVPATRLLWAVLGVALLATAAGPYPELAPLWMLALVGVAVVALADLALSVARGAEFTVTAPAVVRLTKDRPGEVPLFLQVVGEEGWRGRLALSLPGGVESLEPERAVELPAAVPRVRVAWPCTARRRGRLTGLLACWETASRLGWWQLRRRQAVAGELRVYPNLFTERKQLAALFLARGQFGTRLRRTVGRGREFEKLREYQAGDGFDEVHWKATAKRGRPVTKVFQAERTQEIYVVIDASRLSARAVTDGAVTTTTLERYLTAALVLLLAAGRQGDRFGLVVYDDRVRVFLRAGQGAAHYAACRDAVHAMQPSAATPDVAELVRHVRTRLRQRALLFFLTDLTDPVTAEDFVKQAQLLARQHLVLVNQLRPPGVAPLFTGAEVAEADALYGRLAGHTRWAEARGLAQRLHPLGVTATLLENEGMAAQLVTQYLAVKERQAL